MFELVASVALAAALSGAPASERPTASNSGTPAAMAAPSLSFSPDSLAVRPVAAAARSGDSLKNGAIIGAVAGGITVAALASVGCSVGNLLGGDESGCGGATVAGAAIGAGLGALAGVGIDAMFDRSTYAHPVSGVKARRIGLRVRLTF